MKDFSKKIMTLLFLCGISLGFSQEDLNDGIIYKKRVLEQTEIDILSSYYTQDGPNASVTGGIGTEDLQDIATDITVAIPLNDDDVLTLSGTVSAYTSASSSNVYPFNRTYSEEEGVDNTALNTITGSPWVASTGASRSDVWSSANIAYSHSSDDRNRIWSINGSFSYEFDYQSIGFGGSYNWLFNEKNTEIGISGNVYLDEWNPYYPNEFELYDNANQNLNNGFFQFVDILDQNGNVIDKNGTNVWTPSNRGFIEDTSRNTITGSLSFSQILSKRAQISLFADVIQQTGWLANPMQRVYFGDKANYYIGDASQIPNYTSPTNTSVFQLADDFERLPDSRLKIPIGMRFNYYINEHVALRTYYRFYSDDWGVNSHTAEIEIPIKLGKRLTLYPNYRYYTQTAVDYFAPYEQNLSTQEFYTSDYDLSAFDANQYGLGVRYTDIFTKFNIWKFNIKQIDLRYNHYDRSTGLQSDIISLGVKMVFK